ncbi:MAG: hypothetical protein JEZ14_19155 [Marinilabiliaceae bacterium]|nr:hypothetical protein [Marinilabiliaceae bacterium]
MIESINFSLLSNELLFTLVQRCQSFYQEVDTEQLPLKLFCDKVDTHFQAFGKTFERENSSPYTALKAQKDSERDEAFIGLRNYVEAFTHRQNENCRQPATDVLRVIKRYGWSAWNVGYQKETAILNNLIEELQTKYGVQIEALQATQWLEELKTAQQTFEAIKKESVSQATDLPTLTETRPKLEEAMRSLLSMTELLNQADANETFEQLIPHLNALISQTMATAKASATRRKNQEIETPEQN